MLTHREESRPQPTRLAAVPHISGCSRCGRRGRLYEFPTGPWARKADFCGDCRAEWDRFLAEVADRWHDGLRVCFFCRRPLGDHRFPATSPLGASCAECGITVSALIPG